MNKMAKYTNIKILFIWLLSVNIEITGTVSVGSLSPKAWGDIEMIVNENNIDHPHKLHNHNQNHYQENDDNHDIFKSPPTPPALSSLSSSSNSSETPSTPTPTSSSLSSSEPSSTPSSVSSVSTELLSQAASNKFIWKVHNFSAILASGQELIFSPKLYSKKGYRLQLMLVTNTTYQDQSSYLGLFYRIVGGVHDSTLEWPFNYRTVMGVVPQSQLQNSFLNGTYRIIRHDLQPAFSNIINPHTDECRLRNAFLRPNSETDNSVRTLDGCGNRRQIPLDSLEDDRYLVDDTLIVMIEIQERLDSKEFPIADMSMRHNDLVSNYVWTIDRFSDSRNRSIDNKRIAVLSSQPFYTHPNGYLIQLYVTILPRRAAFAISFNFAQGDNDRHLQWPFPYDFEVAVIDQNPNYWKRDLIIKVKPSKSDCGSEVFQQPGQLPEFCFLTIQSLQVLSLTNYNFLTNDNLKIRFTTRFERYSQRQRSSVILHNGALVSEFNWLIPGLMSRFERYVQESKSDELASPTGSSSGSKRKTHRFVSDEFYTNGQGYLCQLVLTVSLKNASDFNTVPGNQHSPSTSSPLLSNSTMQPSNLSTLSSYSSELLSNSSTIKNNVTAEQASTFQPVLLFGLELVIIEGEFDRFLNWPFSSPYELSIVGYSNLPINSDNLYAGLSWSNTTSGFGRMTSSSLVVPVTSVENGQCPKEAFQKPIERNPPCGIKKLVQTLPDLAGRASKQTTTEFGTISGKTHEDLHLRVRIRL